MDSSSLAQMPYVQRLCGIPKAAMKNMGREALSRSKNTQCPRIELVCAKCGLLRGSVFQGVAACLAAAKEGGTSALLLQGRPPRADDTSDVVRLQRRDMETW
eukprot:TRINITY_DN30297_c0_g1_i1.p3 TRINITY_DN30297_c0_g1~~TRINITY_DN30297_c0_g1_i1.p3  ORF type:complete len:102 (-),score=17.31 TRINITY_DN30297_c0_g1_i1:145-450(-)